MGRIVYISFDVMLSFCSATHYSTNEAQYRYYGTDNITVVNRPTHFQK